MINNEVFDDIDKTLKNNEINFLRDYSLENNSYSKTGSLVKRAIFPDSQEKFKIILDFLSSKSVDYVVVGETSNILFLDSVTYGVFISSVFLNDIVFSSNIVNVESGKLLPDFVRELAIRNIEGFEGLEGIPGTLGGAIKMNAGAYGYSISDKLIDVKVLDSDGHERTIKKDDLGFTRRSSILKINSDLFIISARFRVNKGCSEQINKKIDTFHIARHTYQEWVYPNLGSIYSAPNSIYDNIKSNNKYYYIQLWLTRKIWFNKIFRIFNRKKPTNKRLNKLVIRNTDLSKYSDLFSHKNLNTLTNKKNTTLNILSFYQELRFLLKDNVFLENELVYKSIHNVTNCDEYKKSISTYENIIGKYQ